MILFLGLAAKLSQAHQEKKAKQCVTQWLGAGDEEMLCKCFDKCCKAFIQ